MGAWQGRRALIISAAPCQNIDYIKKLIQKYKDFIIICADGGSKYAKKLGIKPNVLVGDFDSSKELIPCDEIVKLIPEKDDTDTQHCTQIAIERGCDEIYLVAATGGRIDHMLSNLFLCEQVANNSARLIIIDEQNTVMLHSGGEMYFLAKDARKYISLIPLDNKLEGVTMSGLKYPLDNAELYRDNIISVSNEAICDEFCIKVARGKALIIFSDDKNM